MKWLGLGIMVAIVCCALVLWPTARRAIAQRGIPPLPASATILGYDAGGMFAQWMLVAVAMEQPEIDSHKPALAGDGAQLRTIPQQAVVMLDSDPGYRDRAADLQRVVLRKQSVNGQYFPWWTTDAIQAGWVMSKTLPNECQYIVYIDAPRRLVFIYWSFS